MDTTELKLLSEEEMTEEIESPTELFYFSPLKGNVRIKGITGGNDYDALAKRTRLAIAAGKRNAPPYAGLSEEAIARIKWAEAGIVEPKMSLQKVIRVNQLYGTALQQLVGRVLALSGISQEEMEQREEELQADTLLE